jgi:predicted ABC-type ATPase
MKEAAIAGYKVYQYFIATEDPAINVERVEEIRVKQDDRTLSLLDEAI